MTVRGRVAGSWAQVLALGFALAVAPAVTALCLALLLPGIAAWFLDEAHGRPMGRAVLTFGTAGAFAPVWHHIQQDQTMQGVLNTAVSSRAVAIAWGLAGVGWLIGKAAQFAVELYLRSQAHDRVRQLNTLRQALEAEWDFGRH